VQSAPTSGKRIIVRNLPTSITREELRELGDRYGRVVNVELVSKPNTNPKENPRLPFGFITFLTEDDAGYTIYRLHDHHYKGNVLEASLSIPKPKDTTNNSKAKGSINNPKKERIKKPMSSLRILTPLNPPSAPPPTPQSNPQSKTGLGWDNAAPAHVNPSVNNQPPADNNGYVQTQSKGSNNNSGKQSRKNNNNRSSRKQNFKAVPEIVEDEVPTETAPESYPANPEVVNEVVHITEVNITIEASQTWWNLKLTDDQLQDFYKAVDPFVQLQDSQ